jgi:hypothetical protein
MTDSTIQTRIAEIDRELIGSGFRYSGVLSSDGAERQQAHEARRSELMHERVALTAQLPQPVTGAQWGHMVIGTTLGTVTVRASAPEYSISQRELDLLGADPFLRFAAEQGEDIR